LNLVWVYTQNNIDWKELSDLYRIAPLGEKKPDDLETVFTNSMFKCFIFDKGKIVGVGRALADGKDCSYICDIAVNPNYQGLGLGKGIVTRLVELSKGHKKIILYANPGKEDFYKKFGFKKMNTAMAIFENQSHAVQVGLVNEKKRVTS
jgi:ribosomal protein S18 acetylase RimI-like enzyme